MQEVALTYGIVAWLCCWWIDLLIAVMRTPFWIDLFLKFSVVTFCLTIIIFCLVRCGGLFNPQP